MNAPKNPKFSLLLATVDRVSEPEHFLQKLDAQSCRGFELIIVDQNIDGRLDHLIELYKARVRVIHIKSQQRGLSRARNLALGYATGDIIAFPDDDCWYPPDLLAKVAAAFDRHPDWDGITGRGVDGTEGRETSFPWRLRDFDLDKYKVWSACISYTIFLHKRVVNSVGTFDESLGVGAGTPWGSGEESDYILRALSFGFRLRYEPSILIYHPQGVHSYGDPAVRKAYAYALGQGRVFRVHKYPLWWLGYRTASTLCGAGIAATLLEPKRVRYHLAVLRGRLEGWLHKDPRSIPGGLTK